MKALIKKAFMRTVGRSLPDSLYAKNFMPTDVDWKNPRYRVVYRVGDKTYPVTLRHSVVSMRPLTIAVPLPETNDAPSAKSPQLEVYDSILSEKALALIRLKESQILKLDNLTVGLFEVTGSRNFCSNIVHNLLFDIFEWRSNIVKRNPFNFKMTRKDAKAIMAFYTCPRPVYLISLLHNDALKVFPMDLVGASGSYFFMGLRLSSPCVQQMKEVKKFVISGVPFNKCELAYKLGKQHKNKNIDLQQFGIVTKTSPTLQIPFPDFALSVREVEIEKTFDIGSHCCFVTHTIRYNELSHQQPLSHVQLFYDVLLKKKHLA